MPQVHITINLHPIIISFFQYLINEKIIPNQGEGIRRAINYFLKKNEKCFEVIQG